MSEDHYTQFRAISHYNKPLLIAELETNIKSWCDWSFLKIGAWENITTGTSGVYGGSFSNLQRVNDPSYSGYTVYQGIRKDWIYETGVNYTNITGGTSNPLTVQVYTGGALVSTGAYHINYPLGRVIFNTGTTQSVKAQYSFRAVQVYLADDIDWWFEVQYDSYNPANNQWIQNLTSGDYNLAGSNRMQLPAVVIEGSSVGSSEPFELGTLVSKNKQDILFHVITQDRFTRNNIADIFRLQEGKTIILYDTATLYLNNLFPLDQRGMKVASPTMYPNIVGNTSLVFRHAIFDKVTISEINTHHPNLHWAIIRATLEVIY